MSAAHDRSEDYAPRVVRALRDENVEALMDALEEWMNERELTVPKQSILNWSGSALLTGVRVADVATRDWDGAVDTDDVGYLIERKRLLRTLLDEIKATREADAASYLGQLDEALPPSLFEGLSDDGDARLDEARGRVLVQTEHILAYSHDVLSAAADGPPFEDDGEDDRLGGVRAARAELEWHRDKVAVGDGSTGSEIQIGGGP